MNKKLKMIADVALESEDKTASAVKVAWNSFMAAKRAAEAAETTYVATLSADAEARNVRIIVFRAVAEAAAETPANTKAEEEVGNEKEVDYSPLEKGSN